MSLADRNARIAGAFTATGQSSELVIGNRKALLKVGGTFTATVQLEVFNVRLNAFQLYGFNRWCCTGC
jgi:hypothetical protein